MNAATLSLVFLIIFGVTAMVCDGRIGRETERCLCQKTKLQKRVKHALVATLEVFPPSASCSYTDIIITLKKGRRFCLDPNGKQGRRILSGQKQKRKTGTQRRKKQKINKQQD
ncbi:C-X-C motif chemokine 3-like [Neoarius graeffei]|uniref:C-X-C motif chemokine 3-like n=1 Tax=Neoarius graeffei TaxID=443677 RepID=UPI00298C8049|nr:C-X-C motif chemokine 3-like [Neoarius graeffei]